MNEEEKEYRITKKRGCLSCLDLFRVDSSCNQYMHCRDSQVIRPET